MRRWWWLAVLAIAGAETTFERAVFLVGESQARCTGAEVDLLHARTHVAGFASGVHSVMAALSSALLSGRVLAVVVTTPRTGGSSASKTKTSTSTSRSAGQARAHELAAAS